jgi:hypothetical protein
MGFKRNKDPEINGFVFFRPNKLEVKAVNKIILIKNTGRK